MWEALKRVEPLDPAFELFDFEELSTRAADKLAAIERARLEAAELAFTGADEVKGPPIPYEESAPVTG
jgi:hypothetical protein